MGGYKALMFIILFVILIAGSITLLYYGSTDLMDVPYTEGDPGSILSIADITVGAVILLFVLLNMGMRCKKDYLVSQEMSMSSKHHSHGTGWALIFCLMLGGVTLLALAGRWYDPNSPQFVASIVIGTLFTFIALLKSAYLSWEK